MEFFQVNLKIESIRENIRIGKIKESLEELNQIISAAQDLGDVKVAFTKQTISNPIGESHRSSKQPTGYCIRTGKKYPLIFISRFHRGLLKYGGFMKTFTIQKNFVILVASHRMAKRVISIQC